MISIIRVRTPAGQAEKVSKRIKPFILGAAKIRNTLHITKEEDTIIWVVEADIKRILKINKNVAKFDVIVRMIFNNKMMKKKLKRMDADQVAELKDMLTNQTSVELV